MMAELFIILYMNDRTEMWLTKYNELLRLIFQRWKILVMVIHLEVLIRLGSTIKVQCYIYTQARVFFFIRSVRIAVQILLPLYNNVLFKSAYVTSLFVRWWNTLCIFFFLVSPLPRSEQFWYFVISLVYIRLTKVKD